jgi:hypothetical protein
MSKNIKQKRKQQKITLYKGWPLSRLRCFPKHNGAIFFMKDPEKDFITGIVVGVNSKRWPDPELVNEEAYFNLSLYRNIENYVGKLGRDATEIPSIENLKDTDRWADRKKYLKYQKLYGREPF